MAEAVEIAVIGAVVTAVGWLVTSASTSYAERERRRAEALLRHVERQLEELYGPLAFLVYEGRRTFEDLLEVLGRDRVFNGDKPLTADELRTWFYWAEADFLPRNERIKSLLMAKTHLVDGPTFPPSYVEFLNHCNSWDISHRRWREQGVAYSGFPKVDWPDEFEADVIKTFQNLRSRHASLIGRLA